MSTLSKGRRTHSRSVEDAAPAWLTAYVTAYALGTAKAASTAGRDEVRGHHTTTTNVSAATTAALTPYRRRRRRGRTGPPVLGRRGGALTGAPRPSVLVITSSVQAGLGTRGA